MEELEPRKIMTLEQFQGLFNMLRDQGLSVEEIDREIFKIIDDEGD